MSYIFRKDLQDKPVPTLEVPQAQRMMCLNESSLDPYKALADKFSQTMQQVSINRYLNDISNKLINELAAYCGCQTNNLIYYNGADDALYNVFTAVRQNEQSFALMLKPSYFDYITYCKAVGLGIQYQQLQPDFDFDVDEYIAKANDPNCRLAILCNPNNPTGNLLDPAKMQKILQNVTTKPVIIDETYFEYSGVSWLNQLKSYPQLLIVRSFSKAFSLAGLRFGYIIANPDAINQLKKVRMFFQVSLLTQAFVYTALTNRQLLLAHTAQVIDLRKQLFRQLDQIKGISVIPSSTNFLLFSPGEDYIQLYQYLQNKGIAVRNVHASWPQQLRVSITNKEDIDAFVQAIEQYLNQANA